MQSLVVSVLLDRRAEGLFLRPGQALAALGESELLRRGISGGPPETPLFYLRRVLWAAAVAERVRQRPRRAGSTPAPPHIKERSIGQWTT